MAVYNAAANQVLISPVSNYYAGKAKRAGLKQAEADLEFKKLRSQSLKEALENAPADREQAKQLALLREEDLRTLIDKRVRDGEIKELELSSAALLPLLEDYAREENEDVALENFNRDIPSILGSLSKKEQEKYRKAAGDDHKFDHTEINTIGLGVRIFADKAQAENLFAKIDPSKYTQASIAKFEKSRKPSDLVPRESTKEPKAPTAAQSKAAGYAQRLREANAIFDELEAEGFDFTGLGDTIEGLMPNRVKSDERQKFDQAKENFINAVLRPESGAAISPTEFEKADKQYFPQPGDGEAVLKQKKANRLSKQRALEAEAGPAMKIIADSLANVSDEDRLSSLGY